MDRIGIGDFRAIVEVGWGEADGTGDEEDGVGETAADFGDRDGWSESMG